VGHLLQTERVEVEIIIDIHPQNPKDLPIYRFTNLPRPNNKKKKVGSSFNLTLQSNENKEKEPNLTKMKFDGKVKMYQYNPSVQINILAVK
jgi:hypothetical protein